MASDGGEGPPIPTRPTVIRSSREEGSAGQDEMAAVPARPAPPAIKVKRPPPAVPPQRPHEHPVEQPVPPRPQPSAPPITSAPATGSSARQQSTKRGRPVITVLDAKPMNQVGFRDVSPTPPTSGGKAKPEITVVGARPMSEVGFRSEGSSSSSIPTQQAPPVANKSPGEQEARPVGVPMRQKSRGPAPPRPASVPAKPPPPRVPSMRQQHASTQGNKLPGAYGDRILVISPEADARPLSEPPDVVRKGPPPRPVSRPQSLHFSGKGSDQDTPSESSGYGSQLLTSESHSSLSSVETPSDAPPARKKPIGVQVLPFGPGMMPLRSQLKSPKGDDSQAAVPRPVPSPRSPRKQPAPPLPSARQGTSPVPTPDTEANVSIVSEASVKDDSAHIHQTEVMVLAPVPKPRAPSPRPRTPRSSTSPPPSTVPSTVHADDSAAIEINPWADINQNKVTMSPTPNVSTESQEAIFSPERSVPMSPSDTSPSPPSSKPSVKPKPSTKPKPAVAAKPKPKPSDKPTREGSIKGIQDQQASSPTDQLYPTLPQDVEPMVKYTTSPTLQPRLPSPLMAPIQPPEVKPPKVKPPEVEPPEIEPPEHAESEHRPKSPPKKPPPARPHSPEKKTAESIGSQPPARPPSHGTHSTENQAPDVSPTEIISQVVIGTQIQEVQSKPQTDTDESQKLNQEREDSQVSGAKQDDFVSPQPLEVQVRPPPEYDDGQQIEHPKSPTSDKCSPIVPELTETNLVSSIEKNTEPAPKKVTTPKSIARLSQAHDSFSDDDDEPDAFYTKKNGRKVVDTSLFSLMAAKKDDDSEQSQMKRYFSETEIREKENTDPAEAFYRNRPEILSTDAIKPTRLKRPTIIRPKKPTVQPPAKETSVGETIDHVGESPEKPKAVPTEDPEAVLTEEKPEVETPVTAPPVAKRPTIIRTVKQKSQEEQVEVQKVKPVAPPVRPKKVPPPVKPKPKPGRLSQEITSPPQLLSQEIKTTQAQKGSPPQTRPKPATPPPPKPKPLSPRPPPVVAAHQESAPNVEVSPHTVQPSSPAMRTASPDGGQHSSPHVHPASPRVAPRKPPGGTPSLLSTVQAGLARTGSASSVEESENRLNELRIRRESDSSTHSSEKVRHPSAASSAGSESGDQESSQTKPEDQRKSWVPPGAVRVMGIGGLPPPLPRTGPVAVSTPDLRMDPMTENNVELNASHRRPIQRSHSPPPRPAPERPITKARPKSMSMMALNRPSFEQEGSAFKMHGEVIQEEKLEASSNAPPKKSPLAPPVKPARPSAPSRKNRSVNAGQTPEQESVADLTPKQPPARPGPPPSSTTKKSPPPRAPPPKVPPQKERGSPPSLPSRPGPGHPLYHYVVQGPHGIAMFDYTATADDELSFKAGDVIELEEQVSEAWIIGRNVDKKGIFPSNFIDIIEPPPVSTTKKREASLSGPEQPDAVPGTGPRCVARFDYDSDVDGDLTFVIGDVISLTSRMGDDWLKGKLSEKEGVFPIAFVEIVEDLPAPCDPGPLVLDTANNDENTVTASYDYSGQEGDLSLKKGDKVKVLSRVDNDWLFGETGGGTVGTFPASFVDRMPKGLPLYKPDPVSKTGANSAESGLRAEPEQAYCIAEYDFTGDEGDLRFMKGDKILLTGRISDEWLKGMKDDKSGAFPKAFVTIMKDLEDPKSDQEKTETNTEQSSAMPTGKAIALYDFKGESEGDLSLKVGDEVVLLKKEGDEWYSGMVGTAQGIFPVGFIKVTEPLPDTTLEPPESFA